ncbi:MAG: sigma-70 family RNA polymerase sigma factor [Pyrinomonadaceae bacterium]
MTEDVTQLLHKWSDGDRQALDELMPIVYSELHRLAHNFLNKERSESIQTTELVHEAFFKLTGQHSVDWQNRSHFFAIASQAMRRILIDAARERKAIKREAEKVPLDDSPSIAVAVDNELLALDEALKELESFDPQQSKIVELRYFGGLTIKETGAVLGISPATVKREWAIARTWLYQWINNI